MNDSQADSLQTRKSERNVARAAKCATDKGLGKTCDVPGKGKGSKPIAAFLQSSEIKTRQCQVIGMLAIENTIAGSLLHNNELLRQSGTQIIGEYKLRISHSFVCLPDENWEDLTEVNSHPIALMQCREFLNQHPQLKVVEGEDTARSAEIIKNENLKGHAAICSKAAAERYGMKVLQEGIETNKHNFTRFLVVADPWQVDELRQHHANATNKASIVFTLPHTEGSLSQVLSILSFYNINQIGRAHV